MPHHIWVTDLSKKGIRISDRLEFDLKWLEPLLYSDGEVKVKVSVFRAKRCDRRSS